MNKQEKSPVVVHLEAANPIPIKIDDPPTSQPKLPSELIQEAIALLWSDLWIRVLFMITAIVIILAAITGVEFLNRLVSSDNQIYDKTGIGHHT